MAVAISSDRATGMIPTAAAAHLRGTTYFEWDPLLASGATEPYLRGVLARLRSD